MSAYGCFNREPFVPEYAHPVGWIIPNKMSRECQYSKTTEDPRCSGCRWKSQLDIIELEDSK